MKTSILILGAAALLLVLNACKKKEAGMPESVDWTPAQVEAAISDPKIQLIDVRSKGEWDSGHIKGAKFIPITEFKSRLAEIDKGRPVITYCAAGGRSFQALEMLKDAGYTKIAHLADGIEAWKAAGKALEK